MPAVYLPHGICQACITEQFPVTSEPVPEAITAQHIIAYAHRRRSGNDTVCLAAIASALADVLNNPELCASMRKGILENK